MYNAGFSIAMFIGSCNISVDISTYFQEMAG